MSAVVGLGRALRLEVVAEGVETEEQLRSLEGLGCDFAQGYYLSRPPVASAASELLSSPRSSIRR